MGGMRAVPGAPPSGTSDAPQASLGSLAPQTGPTESDIREQLLAQVKSFQEKLAPLRQEADNLASVDPTFGKFGQAIGQHLSGINRIVMEYLSQAARKTGSSGGPPEAMMTR